MRHLISPPNLSTRPSPGRARAVLAASALLLLALLPWRAVQAEVPLDKDDLFLGDVPTVRADLDLGRAIVDRLDDLDTGDLRAGSADMEMAAVALHDLSFSLEDLPVHQVDMIVKTIESLPFLPFVPYAGTPWPALTLEGLVTHPSDLSVAQVPLAPRAFRLSSGAVDRYDLFIEAVEKVPFSLDLEGTPLHALQFVIRGLSIDPDDLNM